MCLVVWLQVVSWRWSARSGAGGFSPLARDCWRGRGVGRRWTWDLFPLHARVRWRSPCFPEVWTSGDISKTVVLGQCPFNFKMAVSRTLILSYFDAQFAPYKKCSSLYWSAKALQRSIKFFRIHPPRRTKTRWSLALHIRFRGQKHATRATTPCTLASGPHCALGTLEIKILKWNVMNV